MRSGLFPEGRSCISVSYDKMTPRGNGSNSEEAWLRLIQKGDEQAMRTLYLRHIRYLAAVCSRYVSDDEDVKDVLQEAFLKIFASIGTFEYRGEGSLKGWMTRIVLNESLKFIKNNCRLDIIELRPEEADIPDEAPDTTDVPPSVIHQMIKELPDGYRTIFNLYVVEGKSHKEIAALLGIKENTSASQLHRAKTLLADKIRKYKSLYVVSP